VNTLPERTALVAARKAAGLTQCEVAKRLEISQSQYAMIESGTRTPSLTLAIRISQLFGVSLEALFFDLTNHTS
jgi:putative transcriptional regulator